MRQFREPLNQLKYVSPYAFILEPNICLLKDGALMTTYQIEYPDLESSSANDIAAVAALFNNSIMSLGRNEGWAIFFDVRRVKTKEYPAGDFSNLAGWLIDQRRAENFRKFGEHYTSKYYISFVWQLPADVEEKGSALFFKSESRKKGKTRKDWAHERDLKAVWDNCEKFLDDCDKVMGAMMNKLWIYHLDKSELFSYIKSCISIDEEKLFYPDDVFFFLDNYICEKDVQTSMPLKVGGLLCSRDDGERFSEHELSCDFRQTEPHDARIPVDYKIHSFVAGTFAERGRQISEQISCKKKIRDDGFDRKFSWHVNRKRKSGRVGDGERGKPNKRGLDDGKLCPRILHEFADVLGHKP